MTTAAAPKKEPFRRVSGDEQATRLIALYKRAEKEISTKLLQAVMKAGTKKALSVRRLEQELKAVYKMLDELKKAGESVSVEMVTAAFSGGIRVARKQLEAAGVIEKGTIVAEMGGVNEKAMKVYSSMIGERLADVVTTAGRTTADIYRQLELDSILTGTVSGYETINSKIREMEKTGEAQGLVAFVDRSGREWNMGTYVEMLARTTVMKIHNEAVKNEFIAHGEDLVIISYHLPTCEMCKPWNGKIVSLTGATKDYPTMTEAEADGLFHPNCRHAFSLYIPDKEDEGYTNELKLIDRVRGVNDLDMEEKIQLIADVAKYHDQPYTKGKEDIYKDDKGEWIYPPHNGADYPEELITLPKGTRLERYGNPLTGCFYANVEANVDGLALPGKPTADNRHTFIVLNDLPVKVSRVLPWFDKTGGEVQYRTEKPAYKLTKMIKGLS